MRYLDELVALLTVAEPPERAWILGRLPAVAGPTDAADVLVAIKHGLYDEVPVVRNASFAAALHACPACEVHRLGGAPDADPAVRSKRQERALEALEPVTRAVLAQRAEHPGRTDLTLALALLPHASALAVLGEPQEESGDDVVDALARAHVAAPEARARILRELVEGAGEQPDLLLAFDRVWDPEDFASLEAAARATTPAGRAHLAAAAGRRGGVDAGRAAAVLLAPGETLVALGLASVAAGCPGPGSVELLEKLFRSFENHSVRKEVLRAAAVHGGPGARALCEAALGASPPVQAVALECLMRMKVPREELRARALKLLDSPSATARVNALLVVDAGPESAAVLEALLHDTSPLARAEAAFGLGFVQSPRALECLRALSTTDPSPDVRRQALRSLARYPVAASGPLLVPLLSDHDPRVARAAATALARYAGTEEGPAGCALVLDALDRNVGDLAALMGALEPFASRPARPALGNAVWSMLRDRTLDRALAATRVLPLLPPAAPPPEVRARAAAESPVAAALRHASRAALFLSGDLAAFADGLPGADEPHDVAAEALRLGALLPFVVAGRFPALAAALDGRPFEPAAAIGSEPADAPDGEARPARGSAPFPIPPPPDPESGVFVRTALRITRLMRRLRSTQLARQNRGEEVGRAIQEGAPGPRGASGLLLLALAVAVLVAVAVAVALSFGHDQALDAAQGGRDPRHLVRGEPRAPVRASRRVGGPGRLLVPRVHGRALI
jgi:HEAT repeat protein